MSAADLLPRGELERINREHRARVAPAAAKLRETPEFIDLLAVWALTELPIPQRDDVELLRRVKATLRKCCDTWAAPRPDELPYNPLDDLPCDRTTESRDAAELADWDVD